MSAAPEVRIRPAAAGDAEALALVGAASFLEAFAGVLEGADILAHCRVQHVPDVYAGWLARADTALWLAETVHGAAPVGYAVLTPAALPLPDLQAGDLELKRIYLLHRFHGGGLGARLLQAAVGEARARRAGRLALGVYTGNERAQAFYRRAGFVQVGERRFQVGERQYEDAVMALDL